MNRIKLSLAIGCSSLLALFSCEDALQTTETDPVSLSGINEKAVEISDNGWRDDKSGNPCPYPEIVHKVFAPEDLYDMKSLVWRIRWPECYDGTKDIMIPTVFLPNGALYSINYLNGVNPQTTYNSVFSLYYENTIRKTADMGDVLINAVSPPEGSMESVDFKYYFDDPPPIGFVQTVVENDPGGLVHFYLNAEMGVDEWEYAEGDMLFFKLSGPDYARYGVIWIASMSPRIIDVYMTAKNNGPIDDIKTLTTP